MRRKTEDALEQADVVLFVTDARAGITALDKHFADWLRRQNKPVILGINKCESEAASAAGLAEGYGLGLGDPIALSAEHNIGFGDLYDALLPYFPEEVPEEDDDADHALPDESGLDALEGNDAYDFATQAPPEDATKPIKLAIVGRPNVGKSTLLNALVGYERSMTGPEAGITRDAIAVHWEWKRPRRSAWSIPPACARRARSITSSRSWRWTTRCAPSAWRRSFCSSSTPISCWKNRIC